jgi:hypothetical protein
VVPPLSAGIKAIGTGIKVAREARQLAGAIKVAGEAEDLAKAGAVAIGALKKTAQAEATGADGLMALSAVKAEKAATSGVVAVKGNSAAIKPFYPPNNGFLGETSRHFLPVGDRIDRYGGSGFSRFFSPAGTPAGARALPPGSAGQPLRTFEVVKPFEVEAGKVAPAFGELGLGTQFRTPVPLETLLKRGIIREVTP